MRNLAVGYGTASHFGENILCNRPLIEVRQPLSVIATDADTGSHWLDRDEPNIPKLKALTKRIMGNSQRANQSDPRHDRQAGSRAAAKDWG